MDSYCKATRMGVNMDKSSMLFNGFGRGIGKTNSPDFSYKLWALDQGVNYLGFNLKPNDYKFVDWLWLFKRIKAKISYQCHRWLSRGGKLVLMKSELVNIIAYWLSIAHIQKDPRQNQEEMFQLLIDR
jgi:N-acetylneuraminic acid mutarotase